MTLNTRRNSDLALAVLLAAVLSAAVVLIPVTAVKVVLAIPLALIIPGFVLTIAVFGKTPVELAQRALLAVAMSFFTLILGGMAINYLPGGLNEGDWVGLLFGVTVVGAGIAWYRRQPERVPFGAPAPDPPPAPLPTHVAWRIPSVRPASAIVVVLAVAIAIGAVFYARRPETAKLANGYESLSVDQVAGGRSVRLTINSVRQHTASYKLRVALDNRVIVNRSLTDLKPGARINLTVRIGASSAARQLRAALVLTPGTWTPRVVSLRLPATG